MIKLPHWPVPLGAKPIDLGLERVLQLLEKLGNPHLALPPVVHIAGTNGKGSTLAFLKAMLEAAGKRVHRYTSPHLVYFNERIELCGQPIADAILLDALERCRIAAEGIPITFFEGTTVAALLAFAEHEADIVLLETGMGGRLDATNVLEKPALTILTPISFDHMEFLGDTLAKIAGEKAPIMRPGVPCVVAPQQPEALAVIRDYAEKIGAPLYYTDEIALPCPPALPGAHQITNAKAAVRAFSILNSPLAWESTSNASRWGDNGAKEAPHGTRFATLPKFQLPREGGAVATGLKTARWPARLQKLNIYGQQVWLDGGHNAEAGQILADWAGDKAPISLICGMLHNKDLEGFLSPLVPFITQLIALPIPGEPHCYTPAEIAHIAKKLGIPSDAAPNLQTALATRHSPQTTTLIAGSLYLAGAVLAEAQQVA